jgi:hypothetical protein
MEQSERNSLKSYDHNKRVRRSTEEGRVAVGSEEITQK